MNTQHKDNLTVVQINPLGASLSTGRTTRELHNYLLFKGINSLIACPAPLDCDDAFFFSGKNQMRFDRVLTNLTGLEGHFSRRPTYRLLKYLDEMKPDIVHLRILHSNYINLELLFAYLAKNDIATVITMHDMWFITGGCCYYTIQNCQNWLTGCKNCDRKNHADYKALAVQSERLWNEKQKLLSAIPRLAVVGVSKWVAEEAKKSPILKSAKVSSIYNWIDQTVFYPRDESELKRSMQLEDKFVILGVSASWTLGDRKGLDDYLALSEHLPEDMRIVLIGKMGYEGKLPENIISVPPIKDTSKLAEYYSMADVYLNLSREETFGKVSAEALSCGTPIIAIDSTANKELVPTDGGQVLMSNDVQDILQAISVIQGKTKLEYEQICCSFAKTHFDMLTNMDNYIDVYNHLLSGGKGDVVCSI